MTSYTLFFENQMTFVTPEIVLSVKFAMKTRLLRLLSCCGFEIILVLGRGVESNVTFFLKTCVQEVFGGFEISDSNNFQHSFKQNSFLCISLKTIFPEAFVDAIVKVVSHPIGGVGVNTNCMKNPVFQTRFCLH